MPADHVALVFCSSALLWHVLNDRTLVFRVAALALLGTALFVPFGAYTGLEIAVAAAGSLSVTTVVVCALLWLSSFRALTISENEQFYAAMLLALTGAVLYSSAFGFWWFDPYSLGFDSRYFLICAMGVLSASTFFRWRFIPFVVACVVVAFGAKVLQSSNGFEYTIDPVLWVGSLVSLIIQWRNRRGTQHATIHEAQPGL